MSDADSTVRDGKEVFDRLSTYWRQNYNDAAEDRRFVRMSEQWPDYAIRARGVDRPILTLNLLNKFVKSVVNNSRQNRPSIKIIPQDSGSDPETAEIITGLIRNIEVSSDAESAYDTAIDDAVTSGFGFWRVNLEYANDADFAQDIVIRRIVNPLSVIPDIYSTAPDSSDWEDCFVTETLGRARFKQIYPGAAETDWTSDQWIASSEAWLRESVVRVAEWWQRRTSVKRIIGLSDGAVVDVRHYEGAKAEYDALGVAPVTPEREVKSWNVRQIVMSGSEVLSETDWPGCYIPIIPVYGDEVNIDGRRYFRSLTRDAHDAQRAFNYFRTTQVEMVALQPRMPFIGPVGAFETDAQKWARVNDPDITHISYDGNREPTRSAPPTLSAGMEAMTAIAIDDMKSIMGIFDATLGQRSNETTGVAIRARQIQGDNATFHFQDNLNRAIKHCGRVILDLIPKVYNTERVIRVLGEDGEATAAQIAPGAEVMSHERDEISRIYDVSSGKYDLVVRTGPSFASRREQASAEMLDLIRSFPDAAQIIGPDVVRALDWPGAEDIAKKLEAVQPPELRNAGEEDGGEVDPQVAMLQAQLQQAEQAIAMLQEERSLKRTEVDVKVYDAETRRMAAIAPAMSREEVAAIASHTAQEVLAGVMQMLTQGGDPELPAAPEMGQPESLGAQGLGMPAESIDQPQGMEPPPEGAPA